MRCSYSNSLPTALAPELMKPVVQTVSFSGNAFSVKNARGRFRSPRGHDGSSAKRPDDTSRRVRFGPLSTRRRTPACDGRVPRTGPPRCATAIQSASGSTVLVAQSVKSGKLVSVGKRQLESDDALRLPGAVDVVAGGARLTVDLLARSVIRQCAFGRLRRRDASCAARDRHWRHDRQAQQRTQIQ